MAYTGSLAQAGRGSQLLIGSSATTPAYTTVGEIKSSGISGAQWGTTDVTNFESGADQEFITTIRNNGSVKLEGNRVSSDAGQVLVETAFSTGAVVPWKMILPLTKTQTTTGDTYTFTALVESREFAVDTSKEINYSVSLKISGPVTLTTGS